MQSEIKLDFSRIAQDLQIRKVQVENVVKLLDEGNTIPFITRYRQELTGGLDEELIRQIQLRIGVQRQLAERKQTILKSIENQGQLNKDLRRAILRADTVRRLEDLYLPFKPKKRTRATNAKDKGLEPLALAIWNRDPAVNNPAEILPTILDPDKGLNSVEDVDKGVREIIAEMISESADVRAAARFVMWQSGLIHSNKAERVRPERGRIYKEYFKYSEPSQRIAPHRILAINRGEREGVLKVRLDWDRAKAKDRVLEALAKHCQRQFKTGQLPVPSAGIAGSVPLGAAAFGTGSAAPDAVSPDDGSGVTISFFSTGVPPGGAVDISTISPAPDTLETSGETANESNLEQTESSGTLPNTLATEGESSHAPVEQEPESTAITNGETAASPETAGDEQSEPAEVTGKEAESAPDQNNVADSPSETAPLSSEPPADSPETAPPVQQNITSTPVAALPPLAANTEGEPLSPRSDYRTPHAAFLKAVVDDVLERLVYPSLEKEIRKELREEAEAHALGVYAENLRRLLLQRPVRNRRVLAIDPGFRTGCRVAVLDEKGDLLDQAVIYPHPARKKKKGKEKPAAATETPSATAETKAPASETQSETDAGNTDSQSDSNVSCTVESDGQASPAESANEIPASEAPADEAQSADAGSVPESQTPPDAEKQVETEAIADAGDSESPKAAGQDVSSANQTEAEQPAIETEAPVNESPQEQETAGSEPATSVPSESGDESTADVAGAEMQNGDSDAEVKPDDASTTGGGDTAEANQSAPANADTPNEEPKPDEDLLKRNEAKTILNELVGKHNLDLIALGNGAACRETEEFISELISETAANLEYSIVNEAGVGVYAVSAVGKEDLPDADAALRGAVSIGRRLLDPMSELVKVDPPQIGIGLHQHDVNPRQLRESLDRVAESCINHVGVDLNTAPAPLLRRVAGMNQLAAREIVEHRKKNGAFKNREQLKEVPSVGEPRYVQAAGFVTVKDGDNFLDTTWIHPENYELVGCLLDELGIAVSEFGDEERKQSIQENLRSAPRREIANQLEVPEAVIREIVFALQHPGYDPRDELQGPIFRKAAVKLEDLKEGMELRGTVLNVVDFGVFVDIGLKDSGLVHISHLANRFVKNPLDIVAVGDAVTVWVLKIDLERGHVSLSMIPPGVEKQPRERRRPEREHGGDRQGPRRTDGPEAGARDADPRRGSGPRHADRRPGHGERRPHRPAQTRHGGPHSAPPPPRKPRRAVPAPKLTREALEGKESLRSFGELSAFFTAKDKKDEPKPKKVKKKEESTATKQEDSDQITAPQSAPEVSAETRPIAPTDTPADIAKSAEAAGAGEPNVLETEQTPIDGSLATESTGESSATNDSHVPEPMVTEETKSEEPTQEQGESQIQKPEEPAESPIEQEQPESGFNRQTEPQEEGIANSGDSSTTPSLGEADASSTENEAEKTEDVPASSAQ